MKEVHPGELREQIDIVREVSVINGNGYPEPVKQVVYGKLWAAAIDAADQVIEAGDAQLAQDIVRFVIRHRRGIEAGMLVVFLGEQREIIGVEHVGAHREYLSLKTKTHRAVNP